MIRLLLFVCLVAACQPYETRTTTHLSSHESCWEYDGDFVIERADTMDALAEGACFSVTGELRVTGLDDVSALRSLHQVGTLTIRDATSVDLQQLESAERIDIMVDESAEIMLPLLTTVSELIVEGGSTLVAPQLASIGTLRVTRSALNDFSGFGRVEQIDNIYLMYNERLTSLGGIDDIDALNGDLLIAESPLLSEISIPVATVGGSVVIRRNTVAEDVEAFSQLRTIGGDLRISDALVLTNINGLSNVSVGGTFGIYSAANLDSLSDAAGDFERLELYGNPSLESLFGTPIPAETSVDIVSNGSLEDISALDVSTLSELTLFNNVLTDLQLAQLTRVTGTLSIDGNDSTAINLSALEQVGGNMVVQFNGSASSILFPQLQAVGGIFELDDNTQTTTIDLSLFQNAGQVRIYDMTDLVSIQFPSFDDVGDVFFARNPSLVSFDFPVLTSISDDVEIEGHPNLVDFKGFRNVVMIGDRIEIINNDIITNFQGLENLTACRTFIVEGNEELFGVDAVVELKTVRDRVEFSDNPNLLDCRVDDFVANLNNFAGTFVASNNGGTLGCP